MKNWQEDMLAISMDTKEPHEIFRTIEAAAIKLGFENCAYGIRVPVSYVDIQSLMFDNYPSVWQKRYLEAGYMQIDPVILHGVCSQEPLVWTEQAFSIAPQFWDEAKSFGLRFGWSQSTLDGVGIGGVLCLSRPAEILTEKELQEKEKQMSWLTHLAHFSFSRILHPRAFNELKHPLTRREIEILKWAADGKSSREIAQILFLSKNTIDFHIKNIILKLQVKNKTAAVARAAMMGLLNVF